jgi:hypothetical protein
MATSQMPGRDTSKYARHYAAASDAGRLAEIFSDSYRIALSSKTPDTARDRFALAVEAYHQIMSMSVTPRWDDHVPLKENLAPFPGVRIQVTIPGGAAP